MGPFKPNQPLSFLLLRLFCCSGLASLRHYFLNIIWNGEFMRQKCFERQEMLCSLSNYIAALFISKSFYLPACFLNPTCVPNIMIPSSNLKRWTVFKTLGMHQHPFASFKQPGPGNLLNMSSCILKERECDLAWCWASSDIGWVH